LPDNGAAKEAKTCSNVRLTATDSCDGLRFLLIVLNLHTHQNGILKIYTGHGFGISDIIINNVALF